MLKTMSTTDVIGLLSDALANAGQASSDIQVDGEIHRYNPDKTYSNKKPAWYVAHMLPSGHVAASFGDWRTGASHQWNSWEEVADGPIDIDQLKRELADKKATAQNERKKLQDKAARDAEKLWTKLSDTGKSGYLESKGVRAHGIRFGADRNGSFIAIPMRDSSGAFTGLQRIYDAPLSNGNNKLFGKGTKKDGSWFWIGSDVDNTPILVAEGYATAASLHESLNMPVAVCFDAWNALKVIRALRSLYSNEIILAADNDQWTTSGNTGATIAHEARKIDGVYAVLPDFTGYDTAIKPTDFNDLFRLGGQAAVKGQIENYKTSGDVTKKRWQETLQRSDRGILYPIVSNIAKILSNDSAWAGVIGWDTFALKMVKLKKPPYDNAELGEWGDRDDTKTSIWLTDNWGIRASTKIVAEAINVVAENQSFHPVRDYLTAIQWDGVARIDSWLIDYLGAEDTEYHAMVGRLWMIAAVARILQPGCKMDNVIMLEGGQGKFKSTALSILGGEWFSDTPFELGSKDGFLSMRGKWIIELAELDSFNRAESTKAKHFFAASVDTYREPYGRRTFDVPRQCVFAGTTNTDEYLKDDSGNRRYWPVKTGNINRERLTQDRDMLLAEAVARFRNGDKWWIEGSLDDVLDQQEERYQVDSWEERVIEFVAEKKTTQPPKKGFSLTVGDVLSDCLEIPVGKWTRLDQMRVSSILKRIGFERRQVRNGSRRTWLYIEI